MIFLPRRVANSALLFIGVCLKPEKKYWTKEVGNLLPFFIIIVYNEGISWN